MKKYFTLDNSSDQESEARTKSKIPVKKPGPSDLIIRNILAYSRSLEIHKTRLSGTFNVILN